MRLVIQRVSHACVESEGVVLGRIERGLVILLGVEEADGMEDVEWLCKKAVEMRIFPDDEGRMNCSLKDVGGDVLVVSQFTLHASTKKGNRPSFIRAARPEQAIPLYEAFKDHIGNLSGRPAASGRFGADMQVSLCNDGPVTILMDSRDRD